MKMSQIPMFFNENAKLNSIFIVFSQNLMKKYEKTQKIENRIFFRYGKSDEDLACQILWDNSQN